MDNMTAQDRNKIAKSITEKLSLRSDMQMIVEKNRILGTLEWGKRNSRPSYLVSLCDGQPQHSGIVKGKAKYIIGTNIKASVPLADEWLKRANPKETFQDLRTKYLCDYTIYGGYTIKIIPNSMGVPLWYFHMPFGQHQISIDRKEIKFCKDWTKWREEGVECYPIWYPGCNQVSIYRVSNYKPVVKDIDGVYPALEYESGLKSIDTLKRIQNYKNSLVANNFSSGAVITLFGGKPDTHAQEEEIANRLKGEHTGDEQAGKIVVLFADPGDTPADVKQIQPSDLDKQFESVTKTETVNIFAAHNVPSDLFNYISDTAQVFDVNKIVEQNELFMNSYVIPTQKPELKMLSEFFKLRTGQEAEFEIEQFDPIGLDLPIDNPSVVTALNSIDANIIPKWINKKYKLGIVFPDSVPGVISGQPSQINQVTQVNEHLKNLTGKQTQGIMRIVRKFKSGEYSIVQASMLLKSGFGLTDAEVKDFLGSQSEIIQQRIAFAQESKWQQALITHMIDVPSEDETIEIKLAETYNPLQISVTDLRNGILNQIKGNTAITIDELAKNFNISSLEAQSNLEWLIEKKFLNSTENGFEPTEKAIKKDTNETQIEFYTVYTFGLRSDITGPVILPTTRQWCRDTYNAFKSERNAITIDAIEAMTNDFGMNAFDYRGGFYNDGTEITPWCRHVWYAHTKSRKIKNT